MALKKKRAAKRRAWNKGLEIGQRDAFTPAQGKRIRQVLAGRGVPGVGVLDLVLVAVDTMLQGPELLNLTVKDVQLPNGTIRSIINVARTRRKRPVRCALSEATAKALGKWIAVSGKKRTGYIFSGRGAALPRPMTVRQMNRLLKFWVAEAGLDPKKYGKESLRRTKALHILNGTGDLETVRMLLGHAPTFTRGMFVMVMSILNVLLAARMHCPAQPGGSRDSYKATRGYAQLLGVCRLSISMLSKCKPISYSFTEKTFQ